MIVVRICRRALLAPLGVLLLVPFAGYGQSSGPAPKESSPQPAEVAAIINRIVAGEKLNGENLKKYSPRVETYLQYFRPDPQLGDVPVKDAYFLGRLKFSKKAQEISFVPDSGFGQFRRNFEAIANPLLPAHLYPDKFATSAILDAKNFDQQHYLFDPVRWEYLGDVRCLAIDVRPRKHAGSGAFVGRIWVEDHDYAIVRLNGTRINPPRFKFYCHFDTWRENLRPGVWLPVYSYSEESEMGKRIRYKADTRLWGYDLTAAPHQQGEWTKILVDAPAVRDNSGATSDLSPLESKRQLETEAEQNVLERLEKARLIAPPGAVDKVLDTVVNNLVVTNHLDNLPPVHCRVMLSSPLESFTLRYTIVLSRGLIDVLPDEPSLAMVIAHELAHVALGHRLSTKYAFDDRLILSDELLLANLDLAHGEKDETAADAKAIAFLQNSPYKDKLGGAGLFLRAAEAAAPATPQLFGAHLGNRLAAGKNTIRMAALMSSAPELHPQNIDEIAALPLGSRVQVNSWDGGITFTNRKALAPVDLSEKLPFRIAPLFPYLTHYEETNRTNVAARQAQ